MQHAKNMNNEDIDLLLSKGNAYKTIVNIKDDCITFTQNRLVISFWIAVFGIMGFGMSPWLGGPLLFIALIYLVWIKKIKIFIETDKVIGITGIPPFTKTYRGTYGDVNYVTFREVVSTRTTDGNQAFGRWVIWDVAIHAFKEKFVFSVWEEGNKEKLEKISQTLSNIIGCDLKRITPNKRIP
jgi:hypothetical protein